MRKITVVSVIAAIVFLFAGFSLSQTGSKLVLSKISGWLEEKEIIPETESKFKDGIFFQVITSDEKELFFCELRARKDGFDCGSSFLVKYKDPKYHKRMREFVWRLNTITKEGTFILHKIAASSGQVMLICGFDIRPEDLTKDEFFSVVDSIVGKMQFLLPYIKKVAEGAPPDRIVQEIKEAQKAAKKSFEIEPEQFDRVG